MQRDDESDVWMRERKALSPPRCPQPCAPVLAAVRGHHDHTFRRLVEHLELGSLNGDSSPLAQRSSSIARVPGDEDLSEGMFSRTIFSLIGRGGSEVKAAMQEISCRLKSSGKRREVAPSGPQAGLEVHHRDAQVEGGEGRGQRRASVAVHEDGHRVLPRDISWGAVAIALPSTSNHSGRSPRSDP